MKCFSAVSRKSRRRTTDLRSAGQAGGVREAPTLGTGGPLLPAAVAAPQGRPEPPAAAPSNLDAATGAGPGREPEAQAAENLPIPRGLQSWSWGGSQARPL